MRRLEQWPTLLAEYVEGALGRPFCFGGHDCATFAAGAIEAITGEKVPLPVYADARQAAEALAAESLSSRVRSILGPPIAPASAQRGDVAMVIADGRETLAVCVGGMVAAPGAEGLVFVAQAAAVAAWRV